MKYIDPVQFNKLLNKFKPLKEGGNKSKDLILHVEEAKETEPDKKKRQKKKTKLAITKKVIKPVQD